MATKSLRPIKPRPRPKHRPTSDKRRQRVALSIAAWETQNGGTWQGQSSGYWEINR